MVARGSQVAVVCEPGGPISHLEGSRIILVSEKKLDLYAGAAPSDVPLYTYPEAAKVLDIPSSTLRAWTIGQYYRHAGKRLRFEPLISRPDHDDTRLSFANLLEAFVLRALRVEHGVSLGTIRNALDIAQNELGVDRLLIDRRLRTEAGRLFLDRISELEDLSPHRQFAMREVVMSYLRRIKWRGGSPLWLSPFPRRPQHRPDEELIGVNAEVSFGRPLVARVGVSTEIVALRFDAGEQPAAIIEDYRLTYDEFSEALHFEGRKAA